ncbi:citrate lyase subunit beta [Thalassobacillus devorans]|uniref:Citrate lyase subunit beta n=1 Tax=Thalassobacillus devorans TaxID=279813 RepID=A0ABQ1PEU1_9BACI|nr:CoA ester lyase [Thalassobacillus devorans]NIK29334.1 citrate lyase subunit beta/citryl-CoA lyase [Thalassobacillus devorans]GGC95865.1 citrate lyase subunit beta [Thalassobacillus devorans]
MYNHRSYLFVPAFKQSMIKKAIASEADCVIIDLEDSVAITEKRLARETILESLDNTSGSNVFIRINDLHTPFWEDDLSCAIQAGVTGIMLPKSEHASDIRTITEKAGNEALTLIPLIETAKGVQHIADIANANQNVERLAFGSIDYSLDIDCQLTPGGLELLFARSQIVNASRAAEIGAPIDAVYPDLNNEDGLVQEATLARQLGFKGKLLIHPKQVDLVHQIFSPSQQELEECEEIVEAFEQAEQQGVASIAYNNKLVDYPVYRRAKELLASSKTNV